MRLRLAHALSLTLLAFAGVAVLALGGLTAWQLRNGFGEYLAARDVDHFERFIGTLEARLTLDGGTADLLGGRMGLRDVLHEMDPKPDFRRGRPGTQSMPPPPGHNPDSFPERVQVLAPDGSLLLGEPQLEHPGDEPVVERPVHANGHMVAIARMRPAPVMHTGADARFLHDQYTLLAAGSLGLIALALITGTWLARRWTRPLEAVKEATQRLAQGELTVRLPDGPDLGGRSDEIGDVIRNVNRMAEGLQQLESARRRWLADISHELRTPMTVLRGDIEALHDGVRPLRPEAVAVLREDVLRLNRLVDDLHLLAISDLQTLPCQMADDDAVAMMQRLQRRYDRRATAAGLDLQLQVPDDMPALYVRWDASRIEQLLANLLDNSLRYTRAPGEVRMRLELSDTVVRMVVEDSTPGIPGGDLSLLFEPLYRGDAARHGESKGSGLGLAICRVIATAHDGELSAAASALGGLRLTLILPQSPGLPRPQPPGGVG